MRAWPTILFGSAAALNLAIAAALIFWLPGFVRLMGLDPVRGANLAIAYVAAALIAAFGYGYVRAAIDPVRFRPFIHLGVAGKLAAFAAVAWAWHQGHAPWRLMALGAGDLAYGIFFLAYLQGKGAGGRRGRRR